MTSIATQSSRLGKPVAEDRLIGGGDMGARMRAMQWAKTPLGPARQWPQSLKTAVRIMLTCRQPMFVWWGDELINLYNDAYRAALGAKHPDALGQSAPDVWREIWHQVGPRARSVMHDNEGTFDESLLLFMERYGYLEETYFTFSYSPIPGDGGGTRGVLGACTEDTRRIFSERQLTLLRELAARTTEARTFDEACALSAQCLATNPLDLPFALIYLLDPDRQRVVLAANCGMDRQHPAAPEKVDLDLASTWPFAQVIETRQACLISDLGAKFGDLPTGAWERPPQRAVAVPIASSGEYGQAGVLIAGLNPFRLFDDDYRGFVDLVAAQLAASIGNAQAYEKERNRAAELTELDRAKTAFFSNVSHEFRTPLTLILGPLEDELAERTHAFPAVQRARLETAYRNSLRLLKLVNTLLDFARIQAGRVDAVYEPTDLASLTAELAGNFRSACEQAGLRLSVDCPALPEPVYVDRDMWEKVVLNLLSNAFKFTFQGEIAVTLKPVGDAVELAVQDTGTGIPAEELPRVFERFHRVRGAEGRTHEGTGIGLALVQELASLHGGSVRAESVHGQGSTFTVMIALGKDHLPAEQIGASRALASTALSAGCYLEESLRWLPASPAPALPTPESTIEHRPRIVWADDNADMREYVLRLLGERYEVEAVTNGEEALAAARRRSTDLVLSDVMMPRLDGFGLLRELRADERTRTIPIILLSARAGEEARVEGLESGADDYLIKPFAARELLARISTQLDLARLRHEAAERLLSAKKLEAIRESEERYRALATATASIVWHATPAGAMIDEVPSWEAFTGQTPDEYQGSGWLEALHADDRGATADIWAAALSSKTAIETEFRVRGRDGQHRHMLARAIPVVDAHGELREWVGTCSDISERKRTEKRLVHLANYDTLTSLPNRVLFMDRLSQALAGALRHKCLVAVLFLDLDGFKHINDTLGHGVGDLLLKAIAKRLVDCVRASDTVARFGGDEFALMLTDVTRAADANRLARKILEVLRQPLELAGNELFITTSIGISLYPRDGDDAFTLVKSADAAMYLAKKSHNHYRHYSPAMSARASKRLSLERDLRRALARDEFVLHYQPQIELASGRIDTVEVLLRWRRPESHELVPPLEFIPFAEESGLIVPIGEWVLRAASAQMQAWRAQGLATVRLAVNVSAHQFHRKNMKNVIDHILMETGLDHSCLELELTESILQTEEAERILPALRKSGIKIAIDDFGTGFSSLSYLKRFPVHKLKIDRSFMSGIPEDTDNVAISTAIIAMAHSLRIEVTAEGVETREQLAFLRELGCDGAQGYLLSKPLPAEELGKLLAVNGQDARWMDIAR